MARDHFVHWGDPNRRPTRSQVEQVIRQFFGPVVSAADGGIEWREDRCVVVLLGLYSEPLQHLEGIHCIHDPADDDRERWIEVYLGDDHMDVITRRMDSFTNACAMELAEIFARGWGGKLEAG